MKLNAEDGGNRRFILCTNNENNICRDVTYERIKRIIDKEGYAASLKYYKVDYVPISERLYYEYADELLCHVRELVELENGINFTGNAEIAIVLTEDELARYGRSRAVQGISAGDAHAFLCQLQADTALSPQRTAAARAAAWDAFFRQNAELLPTTLPDALRGVSSLLLTDLTALDYDALGRTLEFLANNGAAVEAQALPGRWDAASGTYTVTDASRAAVQTFFNVSPTEAQASSFKEP